jgi:L,D-transpeptidase ErfK/SrfK
MKPCLCRLRLQLLALVVLPIGGAGATGYPLPAAGNDLIGDLRRVQATRSETLLDIARIHGVGQEEIRLTNPDVDRWLPREGEPVLIPSHYILPDARREGLVLNLPEMRVYHFRPASRDGQAMVDTYPVSIGRMDWKTPLGETRVVHKQRDPSWHPPASIRQEAAAQGDRVPEVVPPGPDNPLGAYALRLGLPGYLIHGTNKPYGVGMRVTHGCVRLLPEDIEELFGRVRVGTPVQILNQPVKTGWQDGVLYAEVHPPLDEDATPRRDLLRFTLERVYAELEKRPVVLDGAALRRAVEEMRGVPVAVSKAGVEGRPITHPLFR